MIKIPDYLRLRQFQDRDCVPLRSFWKALGLSIFSEITAEILNQYGKKHLNDLEKFYCLLRVLGLYGVQFQGRASKYSQTLNIGPIVLKAPQDADGEIIELPLGNRLRSFFNTYKIEKKSQLNGVRLDILSVQSQISLEELRRIFYSSNFSIIEKQKELFEFYSAPGKLVKTEGRSHDDQSEKSLEIPILDVFEGRLRDALQREGIDTLNDLKRVTPNEFKQFENITGKEIRELVRKLAGHNVTLKDDNPSIYIQDALISVRAENVLRNLNVKHIGESFRLSNAFLLSASNCGTTTLEEIFALRDYFGISDAPSDKSKRSNQNYYDEPLKKEFWIRIENTNLPVRALNVLSNLKVEYIWQLLKLTPKQLLSQPNFGKTTLKKIETLLYEYNLPDIPVQFSPDQIKYLLSPSIDEFFSDNPLEELFKISDLIESEAEKLSDERLNIIISKRGIFKSKNTTLKELGELLRLSRERVRQLINKAEEELVKSVASKVRSISLTTRKDLKVRNGIVSFEEYSDTIQIPKHTSRHIIDQVLELLNAGFAIDWDSRVIWLCKKDQIKGIYIKINEVLRERTSSEPFSITREIVEECVSQVLINEGFGRNDEYFVKIQNDISTVIIDKFLKKSYSGYFAFADSSRSKLLCHLFGILFPDGAFIHKETEKIRQTIASILPEILKMNKKTYIPSVLTRSDNIFLWDFGKYIHKDNISVDWDLIDVIIGDCIKRFEDGIASSDVPIIRANTLFKRFESKLIESGIPNQTALYSIIRYRKHPEIIVNDYPNIYYTKVGKPANIQNLISDYFSSFKTPVSREGQITYFCEERGWERYELYQLFSLNDIIALDDGQIINRRGLHINNSKLHQLAELIEKKIMNSNAKIHLRAFSSSYPVLWTEISNYPSSVTLISRLLSKLDSYQFRISGHFALPLMEVGDAPLRASIEKWVCEYNNYVTKNQIMMEFRDKRGYREGSIFSSLSESKLLLYSRDEYVHPEIIGLENEWKLQIAEVIEAAAKINAQHNPYTKFEWIIERWEDRLPKLNDGYYWTKELLANIVDGLGTATVHHNTYVINENPFNILSFDELVSYIMVKNFSSGRCELSQLERHLRAEEVIYLNGKISKSEAFFYGSMLELVDDESFLQLSKKGRERLRQWKISKLSI